MASVDASFNLGKRACRMKSTDTLAWRQRCMVTASLSWLAWAAMALLGCGKVELSPSAPDLPGSPQKAPNIRQAAVGQAPVMADDANTRNPYAFELRISLSDAATAMIVPAKEGVVAMINYAGDPAPAIGDPFADELGFIDLGQVEVDITGKSQVVIDGRALKTDMLKYLQGEPRVNVNVASGRRVFEDNLLDCGSFEDDLKVAIARPVVLHCELLDWPTRRIREPTDGGSVGVANPWSN